ncbi:hypothetical protein [Nonomuraea salmonea]|uniref:hypothetical protein n=1 Tax=Nonomuraea salmonea TaxID=46181 RepID=UPI0031E64EAE
MGGALGQQGEAGGAAQVAGDQVAEVGGGLLGRGALPYAEDDQPVEPAAEVVTQRDPDPHAHRDRGVEVGQPEQVGGDVKLAGHLVDLRFVGGRRVGAHGQRGRDRPAELGEDRLAASLPDEGEPVGEQARLRRLRPRSGGDVRRGRGGQHEEGDQDGVPRRVVDADRAAAPDRLGARGAHGRQQGGLGGEELHPIAACPPDRAPVRDRRLPVTGRDRRGG